MTREFAQVRKIASAGSFFRFWQLILAAQQHHDKMT